MKRLFSPRNKKVIFFDLNQTLIDPKQTFRTHFIDLLNEYTGRWAEKEDFHAEQILKRYEKEWIRRKRAYRKIKRSKLQHICLKKVLQPYPFELTDEFASDFFKELSKRQRKSPILFRNALPTVKKLHEKYKIAIISNSGLTDMDKLGLGGIIQEEHVFTAKKCGARKPNPTIFRTALKEMNIKANQAVMVGNSWRKDIQGALACGIDAIWIRSTASRIRLIRKSSGKVAVQIQHIRQLSTLF